MKWCDSRANGGGPGQAKNRAVTLCVRSGILLETDSKTGALEGTPMQDTAKGMEE